MGDRAEELEKRKEKRGKRKELKGGG